ncbi:TPA: HGGxSTG domain-containing protein [Legionella bozemanae]
MKTTSRTEKKHYAFESAPRCGARTKGNNGQPCRCPAITGKKRCRVHGGALGSGAKMGNTNALKQGYNTKEMRLYKKTVRTTLEESKKYQKLTSILKT